MPKDVFRRHDFCRCVVEYTPGDGKWQNVYNKKWKAGKLDVEEVRRLGYNKNKRYINANPVFVNSNDKLNEYAKKIKPIDGYVDISCHCDEISFAFIDANGNESNVSVKEFADIVKQSKLVPE